MFALDKYISEYFIPKFGEPKVAESGAWMPYQQSIATRVCQCIVTQQIELITIFCARQMGKTEATSNAISCAVLIIYLSLNSNQPLFENVPCGREMGRAFPDGVCLGLFGPAEDTGEINFRRIQAIMRRVSAKFKLKITVDNTEEMIIRCLDSDGIDRQIFHMRVKSAAVSSKLRSMTFNVMLTEEAQDVDGNKLYQEIDPMGGASKGLRIRCGTAGDHHCAYDDEIDLNKAYYPHNHFEFDYTWGVKYGFRGGGYELWCNKLIKDKGIDDESFRREYMLIRNYSQGMLVTEEQFIRMARPYESRWEPGKAPKELPDGICIVASLDVARSSDFTVAKIATADWRNVVLGDEDYPQEPDVIIRWQKTYPHEEYDSQFDQIDKDFDGFPLLKPFGVVAVDHTGARGNMVQKFENRGYSVIPVTFSGGIKLTEWDKKTGQLKTGSKSSLCQDYMDQIRAGRFGYAADENYMGTQDFSRCSANPLALAGGANTATVAPQREYLDQKHQLTHCFVLRPSAGRVNLQADPKNKLAFDDQVDADLMLNHAAQYYVPVSAEFLKPLGETRELAGMMDATLRGTFDTLTRVFQ